MQAVRVVASYTGAQFESGAVHRARGLNEPAPGVVPEPRGMHDDDEPQPVRTAQPHRQAAIDAMFRPKNKEQPELHGAPGRQREKRPKKTLTVNFQGKECEVIEGNSSVEDPEWVYIIGVDSTGNKHYLCRLCGFDFHGRDSRVISHCLRITGEGVKVCSKQPSQRCRDVCHRARELKRTGKSAAVKDQALARTPSINLPGVMSNFESLQGDVDQALAEWAVAHDISAAAIDSRNNAFKNVLTKLFAVGARYSLPPRETLMDDLPPSGTSRPGGLHLAREQMDREKAVVLNGAEETGGTLVSDGAKLSTRKRGMINSSLALPMGLHYVQQTDATGQRKDAVFLKNDLSRALEKCGNVSQACAPRPPPLPPSSPHPPCPPLPLCTNAPHQQLRFPHIVAWLHRCQSWMAIPFRPSGSRAWPRL